MAQDLSTVEASCGCFILFIELFDYPITILLITKYTKVVSKIAPKKQATVREISYKNQQQQFIIKISIISTFLYRDRNKSAKMTWLKQNRTGTITGKTTSDRIVGTMLAVVDSSLESLILVYPD